MARAARLHFMHIRKTGGTAIKAALRSADVRTTPYGELVIHPHDFRLRDVPPGDRVIFCVRDPISRFLSGFYSRLNKGQPRFFSEWRPWERAAFERFPTPQELATALASDDEEERQAAMTAMRDIRHIGSIRRYLGSVKNVRRQSDQILYVARQETLALDWPQIRSLLGLPRRVQLPSDPVLAHRRDPSLDASLDDAAMSALREWYAKDYRIVRYCERLRFERGWGDHRRNWHQRARRRVARAVR
jgi:hypothetical protein